jgi:hypothetical protein
VVNVVGNLIDAQKTGVDLVGYGESGVIFGWLNKAVV